MQSGDRQQVRQSRISESLLDLFGDGAAFAGNQGRGDTARRAGQDRRNAPRHLGAQLPQIFAPSGFVRRPADPVGSTKAVADPIDPGEIEFALDIAAIGQ
jgi:hypothetical protein